MKRVLKNNKQAFTIAGFKKFSGKLFLKKFHFRKKRFPEKATEIKIVENYV